MLARPDPSPKKKKPKERIKKKRKARIKGQHQLTDLFCKSPNRPRGRYADGKGLWLSVSPTGSRSWLFQYSRDGKIRSIGLGSYRDVSLEQARHHAAILRADTKSGIDPLAERNREQVEARVAATSGQTFREAADEYIEMQAPGWKSPKSREQWTSSLETYAMPLLGKIDVAEIDTAMVVKVLKPIWPIKPETASRIRSRIKLILDAAKANEKRTGENPAMWSGHLSTMFPKPKKVRKVRPMPAMPWQEVPAFMAKLAKKQGTSIRALEVLILTATRTNSLIGMREEEIDFAEKLWVIPAERMKGDEAFKVTLSDKAISILKSVPRERGNPYMFAGLRRGAHLSNMALLSVMQNAAPAFVPHGFRSSFRDWAAETTDAESVAEMALQHKIKSPVEAAYRRGKLIPKRRALMDQWAAFLYPGRK